MTKEIISFVIITILMINFVFFTKQYIFSRIFCRLCSWKIELTLILIVWTWLLFRVNFFCLPDFFGFCHKELLCLRCFLCWKSWGSCAAKTSVVLQWQVEMARLMALENPWQMKKYTLRFAGWWFLFNS